MSPLLLIGLGILAVLFLVGVARWFGGLSLFIAGALWAGAIVGVLHASERFLWIDRYPSVSRILAVYAPRLGTARDAQPTAPVSDTPASEPTSASDVSHFVGLDNVWQSINDLLDSQAEITSTAQPATLVLLVGQRGTGKSSVSAALAEELAASSIVKSSHIETISVTSTSGLTDSYGPTPEASTTVSTHMQRALDGVLRIEDIDANTSVSTGPAIAAIGAQLLTTARTYPGRLLAICTGSHAAVAHLNNCLGQLNVHRIDFADLSDEALCDLFVQLVEKHGLLLAENAASALRYKIQEIRDEQGQAFENAYTVHKLFDQVNYARGLRVRQPPGLPEQERHLIQREDIQKATA
jgi:energy-coupling factor transporter ATP-binding protein EcfA2